MCFLIRTILPQKNNKVNTDLKIGHFVHKILKVLTKNNGKLQN